jgi:cytochrome c oxidase cbb3-type subunit I/II
MIRTLVPDVLRYGEYSRLGESIYDHPFQWGSKRTGPDLARISSKYPNAWHYNHMRNPRDLNTDSNMPSYPWLLTKKTDLAALSSKIAVQRRLGVPFPPMTRDEIRDKAIKQGIGIAADLKANGAYAEADSQIIALIAYLQNFGKFDKPADGPGATPWVNRPFPLQPGSPDKFRAAVIKP